MQLFSPIAMHDNCILQQCTMISGGGKQSVAEFPPKHKIFDVNLVRKIFSRLIAFEPVVHN